MKKKFTFFTILAVILVASVMVFTKSRSEVKGADISLDVSSDHAQKGDEVTLTVTVKSSVEMSKIDAYITYDSNAIEFVSSSSENVVGTAGTLHIYDQLETASKEMTYSIVLIALETGSTEFNIGEINIEDKNDSVVQILRTQADVIEVQENEEAENDGSLSELLVVPGELDPEFNSDVTSYQMTVDSDVDELILSAIPSTEDSIVTVDQPEKLQQGENEVTITVTAPSGSVKVYQINVIKK